MFAVGTMCEWLCVVLIEVVVVDFASVNVGGLVGVSAVRSSLYSFFCFGVCEWVLLVRV